MIFEIKAVDQVGSAARIATEDAREALQSLLAFEAAGFHNVTVRDAAGAFLMASDLIEIAHSAISIIPS